MLKLIEQLKHCWLLLCKMDDAIVPVSSLMAPDYAMRRCVAVAGFYTRFHASSLRYGYQSVVEVPYQDNICGG